MTYLCNPHAEPNAPREPNCPIHGLARCDREIERICEEARAGIGDAHGIYQGLHDWRTEKKLIANEALLAPNWQRFPDCYGVGANERTSRPNPAHSPNSNTEE